MMKEHKVSLAELLRVNELLYPCKTCGRSQTTSAPWIDLDVMKRIIIQLIEHELEVPPQRKRAKK